MVEYHGELRAVYKIYTAKRGIEFRVGVKTKVLMVLSIVGLILFVKYLEQILEYMIAGF